MDGEERGGGTISWWSAWGERCMIGSRGLEAEVIGGAGGLRVRKMGNGNGAKVKRAKTFE